MKIPSVFAVLVVLIGHGCAAGLKEWRKRSAMNAYDVLEAADEAIGGFEEFQTALRGDFKKTTTVIANDQNSVNVSLDTMIFVFVRRSYKYVLCNLLEYFEIVAETLRANDARTVRGTIRLPGDHEYCAHTLFHDFGFDVEMLFESTWYFRTFAVDDADLAAQARKYRVKFGHYLKGKKCPLPRITEEFTDALAAIKRTIADFSRVFCSRWTPLVGDLLVANTAESYHNDDGRNQSHFIEYLFHHEKCSITFESFDTAVKSQSFRITSWDCGGILETEEYNITRTRIHQQYKGDDKEHHGIRILEKIVDCVCLRFLRKPDREAKCTGCKNEFTLAALKNQLKSNNYYLNAVIYYNVESEAAVLVSIKEGKKMLKGIRRAIMGKYCTETSAEKIVGDMLEMWTPLTTFKSLFDQLLVWILKIKRIDLRRNGQNYKSIRKFQSKLNLVLYMMENIKLLSTHKICGGIFKHLNEYLPTAAEYHSPEKMEVEEYDFTQPTLNIMELYHYFSVNTFL